jgi:hypothetical protein
MDKNTRLIAIVSICLIGLCIVLAATIIAINAGNDDHLNAINKTLVGMNITYHSFAGKPMNYTVVAGDIGSVDRAEFNGQPAWEVRVGQGLAWDITMDASGKQILNVKQLFQT